MNRLSEKLSDRSSGPNDAKTRRFVARVGQWLIWCRLPMLSGVLLWLSFPPVDWSVLAWFALVPLTTLIRVPWRSRPIYRPALAGGLVFGLLSVHWIRYADEDGMTGYYGWWALASYMALYFPVFLLVARVAVLRFRVPAILTVPIVWVGLEYLRSWLLTGFPWYFLAHTQYGAIALIQIADLAGAYGVSFLVALVNGWLADLLGVPLLRPTASGPRLAREQVWRLGVVVTLFAATIGYGFFRLDGSPTPADFGPRVVLVQTNVPQTVKNDESQVEEIRRHYRDLLDRTAVILQDLPDDERPLLVIWPETSYVFGLYKSFCDRLPLLHIDPAMSDEDLRRVFPDADVDPEKVRRVARAVRDDLPDASRRLGVPMLMGLNVEEIGPAGRRLYNSAILVSPDGGMSPPYHKIHLVPWGEYLPFREWLPWLHIFTPHASADYGLEAGTEAVRFRWAGYSFGVLICFEDTVPWAARAYSTAEPVDFLVNTSNDGWFGVADEATGEVSLLRRAEHAAHLAIGVFRAVECRRPIVRAVNTGISAIIDSNGRIIKASGNGGGAPGMTSEVLVGEVPLDRRRSVHVRAGDWLGILAFGLVVTILFAGFGSAVVRRRGRAA